MDFKDLNTLIEQNNYAEFIAAIDKMNAVDLAEYLEIVSEENLVRVFRMLKKDRSAEIFAELDISIKEKLIRSVGDSEMSKILDLLYTDDVVDMLEELPANAVYKILQNTDKGRREEINKFLRYPDDSAGGIMTSELVRIRSDMTVSEAIDYIRSNGAKKETVYVIYVTDASRTLIGTVGLRDLLFSSPDSLIRDIMNEAVIYAFTSDDRESVAKSISKYNLLALPVVDSEKRLVGIVTVDDALDVIEEETTKEIEKMAAIVPSDRTYFKTGVFETFKKRIPWLLLLMISAVFTGAIITYYEEALGKMVILTSFIPMLMDTGGNAGAQASVTIIRSLSLGEIKTRDALRILAKEFRVSLLCAAVLGAVSFAKVMLIDRAGVYVALTVGITLAAAIIVAKLVGGSLPLLAKRLGLDPAVMASPFITTTVDAIALIIYFNVASLLLPI